MTALERGITISLKSAPQSASPRIELSSGTWAAPAFIADIPYVAVARVPRAPWRTPSPAELEVLLACAGEPAYATNVSVISIPSDIMAMFAPLGDVIRGGTTDEVRRFVSDPSCAGGLVRCQEYVRQKRLLEGSDANASLTGGIRVNRRGLPTVTVNTETGKQLGLHVDNWYFFDSEDKAQAPNRVCINVGVEDRFLLFLPVPFNRVYETLIACRDRGDCELCAGARMIEKQGGTEVGRLYMRHFPEYPVVRLRITPGEAYVAPTENLVHDGSTLGVATTDVILSIRPE